MDETFGMRGVRILIIDDNPVNLRLITDHLQRYGVDLLIARDGELGIQRAKLAQPALILLDVVMPGIDGFEICRRLKADAATQDIPVIFMTSLTDVEDKIKAFRMGAVDYITKPVEEQELLARVTTHFNLRALTYQLEMQNTHLQQLTIELAAANEKLSDRVREEEAAQQRLVAILEATPDFVGMADKAGNILYINRAGRHLVGLTENEDVSQLRITDLHAPVSAKAVEVEKLPTATRQESWGGESIFKGQHGQEIPVSQVVIAHKSAKGEVERFSTIARDITQRKQIEAQLKTSLQEKEILLKEIHHRVKNNLQIIVSLLDLQAADCEGNDDIHRILDSAKHRVKSMAFIHERLYQSHNLSRIDFAKYIDSLINHLRDFYGGDIKAVNILTNIAPVALSIELAIPCGLIINELVSNAFKHAFPDGRAGEISIMLTSSEPRAFTLQIRDNGVGLPANIDIQQTQSLGITLVRILIKQIGGEITWHNDNGLHLSMFFRLED